jgi:hypothetical protein
MAFDQDSSFDFGYTKGFEDLNGICSRFFFWLQLHKLKYYWKRASHTTLAAYNFPQRPTSRTTSTSLNWERRGIWSINVLREIWAIYFTCSPQNILNASKAVKMKYSGIGKRHPVASSNIVFHHDSNMKRPKAFIHHFNVWVHNI